MNHTLYPVILLPVTVLVLAGATCMGYIYSNEKLLQLQFYVPLEYEIHLNLWYTSQRAPSDPPTN